MSGLFITFEGGEGAGKTTQARLLAEHLAAEGRRVVSVHEPGGTPLGEYIRNWVKSQSAPLTPEAELLLFTAARAELAQRVIKPALEEGAVVIADRYADSTTVYQGCARGLPADRIRAANDAATDGLWPDLTFLLDAPPEAGMRRVRLQTSFDEAGQVEPIPRAEESGKRRFEELGLAFHRKVREGYLQLAEADPDRWVALDATQSVEDVHAEVWDRVSGKRISALPTSP